MWSSLHHNLVVLFEFDMMQKLKAQNQRIEPIWKHRSCLGLRGMWSLGIHGFTYLILFVPSSPMWRKYSRALSETHIMDGK